MSGVPTTQAGLQGAFQGATTAQPKERKRPAPFSLRLSAAERARLEKDAGETPLATYIKFRLFHNAPELTSLDRRTKRHPSEARLIAKLLAVLGEARLANNLNQLAKAANMGTLPVTPETEKALQDAYVDILWMRKTLVQALGLRDKP